MRQIFSKHLSQTLSIWKKTSKKLKIFQTPRLQKKLSFELSLKKKQNDWITDAKKIPKRTNSVNFSQNVEFVQDFGTRLHKNAKEIEKRKEEYRKSIEPEYSFTPKLSTGTEKWLISRSKKELRGKNEEVAVVSGSSLLKFTGFAHDVKNVIQNKIVRNNNDLKPNKLQRVCAGKRLPSSKLLKFSNEGSSENINYLCF